MSDRYEPSRSNPPAADRPDPPLAPLVAYWLGLSVLFGALITVILPSLVAERVDPSVKSSAVALIAAVEALVAITVQPIAGAFSDHHRTRWGRRHPWIVVGVALQVVALLALIVVPGYWWLLLVMVCVELTSNSAQGPYQGLLPDLVPVGHRGRASGLMGAAQLGGQILGAAIAGLAAAAGAIPLAIVFAAASVALGAAATVLGVHEPDDAAVPYEPLDGQLAVVDGDDDPAAGRFQGTVDNQDVIVPDARPGHRIARDPDKKGGRRVLDQQLVEIQLPVDIILSRGGKTGGHAAEKQGPQHLCFLFQAVYFRY